MIVILRDDIEKKDKVALVSFLEKKGFKVKAINGEEKTVLGAVGSLSIDPSYIKNFKGVEDVVPISKPYKLASRELKKEDTIIEVGNVKFGGNRLVLMAGPCSVESKEQVELAAEYAFKAGATVLRGGAFKPRTSPYSFQGLGEEGLKLLKGAGDKWGMPIVSEIVSPEHTDIVAKYVDIFQIGARNMQNFELLKSVGKVGKPVILKRGLSATIEELLMAAEYLMVNGTDDVILCERGIRTYETATRNTLDLSMVPVVKGLSHLPVIVDPSHGTGRRDSVIPMALAGIVAGADGIIVEMHPNPDVAISDGHQSLFPEQFEKLVQDIEAIAPTIKKEVVKLPKNKNAIERISSKNNITSNKEEVGFQGEKGAYSEIALYKSFNNEKTISKAFSSFKDVFDAILTNDIKYGILPIENTLGGSVHDNYDLILRYPDIFINGEERIKIEHNLIVNKGVKLENIKKVYSHPQALAQCSRFLKEFNFEMIPYDDTSGAVRKIKEENLLDCAAIASRGAAKYWDMEILKNNIETNPNNYTRFFILSNEKKSIKKADKASLVFSVKDKTGSLLKILSIFSKNKINLKKLESRPILGKPWEYMFYVDIEISTKKQLNELIDLIKKETTFLRLLGFYNSGI